MSRLINDAPFDIPFEEPENDESIVWRYSKNPIIRRHPVQGIARIFNSAVTTFDNRFVGVFRAEDESTLPHLRVGWSDDGIAWTIDSEPIRFVDSEGRQWMPGYAYDPRVVAIDNTYYLIWCTEFHGPTIGLAKTDDFKTFIRLENAFLPFNRNGVLFPRTINGVYKMLSRPSDSGHTAFGDIFISESPDLVHWGRHRHVMSKGGTGWWQNLKIGSGPAPIETDEGWLLFYHGVTQTCNGFVYSMGAALLDIDEPSVVLKRTNNFLLTPEMPYEETGFVPNVVFPCAALSDAKTGRIAIYYGSADTYVSLAFTTIEKVMAALDESDGRIDYDADLGR
jgi:beta-1,4-mannooligosaccharide/beta-1,4-mannosyl-N-acetylglucosamine phosphorylase